MGVQTAYLAQVVLQVEVDELTPLECGYPLQR